MKYLESTRWWIAGAAAVFLIALRWLSPAWALLAAAAVFTYIILLLPRYAPRSFRGNRRILQRIAWYPLVAGLYALVFPDQMALAGCAFAIFVFGDSFAAMLGARWPLLEIPWNPDKSLGGALAFLLIGWLAGTAAAIWIGPVPTWQHAAMAAFFAASLAAFAESLALPVNDDLVLPIIAPMAVLAAWGVDLEWSGAVIEARWLGIAFLVNAVLALSAWWFKAATAAGASIFALAGIPVMSVGGAAWHGLLVAYFAAAIVCARAGRHEKAYLGISDGSWARQDIKHVPAVCALPALVCLAAGATGGADALLAAFFAASLATSLSDTVSAELGQIYGKKPFMATTLRRVQPGTAGAVSAEGTLLGMGAALVFVLAAWSLGALPAAAVPAAALGAWMGAYAESLIASHWAGEGIQADPEWLNLINSMIGGTVAVFLFTLTG